MQWDAVLHMLYYATLPMGSRLYYSNAGVVRLACASIITSPWGLDWVGLVAVVGVVDSSRTRRDEGGLIGWRWDCSAVVVLSCWGFG